MTDTTQTILPPWTGQILDEQTEPNTKEQIIPVHEPALRKETVTRVDSLGALKFLLRYFDGDCYLRLSAIDGNFYLHMLAE